MKVTFLRRVTWTVTVIGVLLAYNLPTARADNQYIRDLADMRCTTFEDGCRAIMMLEAGEIPEDTFVEIARELTEKGIIKEKWQTEPARLLDKGRIAYMVCKALGIKGGLTMRIFGVSGRYGLRALTDLKIMVKGADAKYVSGGELLGIVYRAQEYRNKKAAKKEAEAGEEAAE